MNDILPLEVGAWQYLEATFRRVAALHGFAEVRTPLLEQTALFTKEIGEQTDVVEKEMYSFERHGDALTVRPEGTASCARAYVEHGIQAKEPVSRWYYLGPMFRGERPAKGRYRQFHQLGAEHYGDPGPVADAEMIGFAVSLLTELGIPECTVHVNSLGSGDTRGRYREALRAYFEPRKGELSEDSQRRLEKNPLRILDSKSAKDKEVSLGAPSILDVLGDEDRAHWDGVRRSLDLLRVPYVVDPALVRGLDYYTRTLFEVKTSAGDLGAQNTLIGGGRYDEMIGNLGGTSVPAIGFAAGVERLLATMPSVAPSQGAQVYVAPLESTALDAALPLARELRGLGVSTELDGRGLRVKAMLRRADALGSLYAVILGQNELSRGVATLKDLSSHTQEEVPLNTVSALLATRLRATRGSP